MSSFTLPPSPCLRPRLAPRASGTCLKEAASVESEAEAPTVRLEPIGSIVEFDDGKHGRCLLGIITKGSAKAKGGGSTYEIVDSKSELHHVQGKHIHVTLPASKGKETEPALVLAEFEAALALGEDELGVAPDARRRALT